MIANQLKKDDFYLPIIRLLDGLGGSASIEEIEQKLIEEFAFTDEDLAVAHEKSGTPIIPNKIAWSRSYLKEAGLLANERRGVWVLTEDGRNALVGGEGAIRERVANAMREYQARRKATVEASAAEEVPPVEALSEDGTTTEEVTDWRDQLLAALKAMDPYAFERLCQRLLRERLREGRGHGEIGRWRDRRGRCSSHEPDFVPGFVPVQTLCGRGLVSRGAGFPRSHAGPSRQGLDHHDGQLHGRRTA